jgi:hypothetical protein
MTVKTKKLCHDERHYCIECCSHRGDGITGSPCALLGNIGNGIIGCRGEEGNIFDGMRQSELCTEFNCLDGLSEGSIEIIEEMIKNLPSGEFKMSNLLKFCKKGEEIARQLGTEIKYTGFQYDYLGRLAFHSFFDGVTESEFLGRNLEEAQESLRELRKRYDKPLPEI